MPRKPHSVSNPSHLHDVGGRIGQRGDQLSSSAAPVSLGEGSLGNIGSGTLSNVNQHLAGVGQHTRTMGGHLSRSGDKLHQTASNIEENESTIASNFGKIHSNATTRPGGSTSGGGVGPVRPGKHSGGGFHPYGGRPSKPGGGGPNKPGPGGNGGGRPPSPSPSPPPPPPPPAPTWGDPGFRPPNFNPTIPQDTHDHVSHGSYNDANGKVTGGHVYYGSTTTNPAGQQDGTIGHGAWPNPARPNAFGWQNNGVHKLDSPDVYFGPQYGNVGKDHDNHTMFPPGTTDTQAHQMGSAAWNDPNIRFWQNDGRPGTGGDWSGETTIPNGHPYQGMPIKINGRWGPDGSATTYFPSPNQPGGTYVPPQPGGTQS